MVIFCWKPADILVIFLKQWSPNNSLNKFRGGNYWPNTPNSGFGFQANQILEEQPDADQAQTNQTGKGSGSILRIGTAMHTPLICVKT